jgi:hypothetical protein
MLLNIFLNKKYFKKQFLHILTFMLNYGLLVHLFFRHREWSKRVQSETRPSSWYQASQSYINKSY